jgi:hypothetical protein
LLRKWNNGYFRPPLKRESLPAFETATGRCAGDLGDNSMVLLDNQDSDR